jgi:uncharacterized protein (UPF0254 family)
MSLGLAEHIRNAWGNSIAAAIDAGAGRGKLCVYDGPRPRSAGSPTTLLAELVFSKPCAQEARRGLITFGPMEPDSDAKGTGRAAWARATDSEGNFVADFSVGPKGSNSDIVLDGTTAIEKGQIVSVLNGSIQEGNP